MTTPLVNSDATWSLGAFNRGATGHPNYGWGTYDNVTHNILGNKVFALRWPNGTTKKIAIESMLSTGAVQLKVANLDNSGEQILTLNKTQYLAKNHVFVNLGSGQILDLEPNKNDYQLVFGKYVTLVQGTTPYAVTGVRTKSGVWSTKATGVDTNTVNPANHPLQNTAANAIGWDWKTFVMNQNAWQLADSTAYLLQATPNDPIYQLVFKSFSGSSTGTIGFSQRILSSVGQVEAAGHLSSMVYPNPSANGQLGLFLADNAHVAITSASGQLVWQQDLPKGEHFHTLDQLQAGLYTIRILSNGVSTCIRWQTL
jgi:hypothetical protein